MNEQDLHERLPEGPTRPPEPPKFVGSIKPYRYRAPIPWWSLINMSLVMFIIVYQVVPEFQAWVNYCFRYWGRYPGFAMKYMDWWLRQPPGASDA